MVGHAVRKLKLGLDDICQCPTGRQRGTGRRYYSREACMCGGLIVRPALRRKAMRERDRAELEAFDKDRAPARHIHRKRSDWCP